MHPRNKHRNYLDYRDLAKKQKGLKRFVFENQWGGASIDYSNQEALEELTRSLLAEFYNIQGWRIPAGYLCPPVPQRVDYIHIMADLLQQSLGSKEVPRGESVCGLDLGTGASCIYSLLGAAEYGWSFLASDVDQAALENAEEIVARNELQHQVTLRCQKDPKRILRGALRKDEVVAFSLCNPPFHETLEHARRAASDKWQRLGNQKLQQAALKNYQGREAELCCEGGEVGFVTRLLEESAQPRFRESCVWFSSLLSRSSSLEPIHARLGELKAKRRRFELRQGRNVKWVVAWSFMGKSQRAEALRKQLAPQPSTGKRKTGLAACGCALEWREVWVSDGHQGTPTEGQIVKY
ncbi:unnamed protein product [Effrenium voratum]|uniref:U6 small nuclear RNA (adenine-(43)-N(6))-methyltransferase n=1 Tax=Effrenium voratum TaxID=2562239 RepID=A0AA36NCH3_9DINO|nr:unnamed protein product [Effrenium voratum]CAJ1420630.1 unnamed protein product [Effrenium voratum]